MNPTGIIISRTDSIGDVMLTLPMCGILKHVFPGCPIYFLGRNYTQAIIESCEHVDEFINWDELKEQSPSFQIEKFQNTGANVFIHVFPRKEILWLAKRAGIAYRIATGRRLYTLGKCNKLVFFTRKGSSLHEAQLNLKLLRPLGIDREYTLPELSSFYGFNRSNTSTESKIKSFIQQFSSSRKKIIMHPLSKGSASEWSLENYAALIQLLPSDRFDIFITGTKEEGEKIKETYVLSGANVHDVTGKFSLEELIVFIRHCDLLLAASTGPLHIAAASGIYAVGLYSPKRPIHPGRWAPIGEHALFLTAAAHPRKGEKLAISPDEVLKVISSALA